MNAQPSSFFGLNAWVIWTELIVALICMLSGSLMWLAYFYTFFLKDPLELFEKWRKYLPGSRFLSSRDMTWCVKSDIKPHPFLRVKVNALKIAVDLERPRQLLGRVMAVHSSHDLPSGLFTSIASNWLVCLRYTLAVASCFLSWHEARSTS